ncbi:copper resistance protein CopC [Micrococcus sp.]|uniref:copper resistance CopC family protein n=1 Tax=Micrococcus sp. TaxID=1271 RepID=UPI002A9094B1|nr:copper resistance protein CopC [Micrococcus sp.]MDY6054883.1 copper resistance protein CopC [Micrococcus sp.]
MPQHHPLHATLAACAVTATIAAAAAGPAVAHDELVEAVPADGATLTEAPEAVTLTFSGELIDGQGIQNLVQVTDAAGHQWQDGAATVDGPTLTAPLCADLPRGEYDVAYRVVYSDGHSEERSLDFTVEDPQAPAPGTAPSGCGLAAAGTPGDPAEPPVSHSGDAPVAGDADPAASPDAPDQPAAADTTGSAVPGWVWAAGLAGLAVIGVGFAVLGRKARALDHR